VAEAKKARMNSRFWLNPRWWLNSRWRLNPKLDISVLDKKLKRHIDSSIEI
jgi:hypothetical protein